MSRGTGFELEKVLGLLTTMVYFLWKYCYPTPLLLYDKDKEIFPVATLKQFVESSFCPFSYGGPYGGRFGRED